MMMEPVCLIENDSDGNLCVVPESVKILERIEQPVVVVAVVGLYRTGKSYLMNRLASKKTGFALGATIQSKTKGIWMWCVPHPTKPEHTLVLLDTEGLGDVEKGDEKNDTWIFCLAVLLSSVLVYNSMGTIDNRALENLNYVTELAKHIKVKDGDMEMDDKSTELMKFFPSFVWTVRDFTLILEIDDKPITADDYLTNSLKLLTVKNNTGNLSKIEEYNRPRLFLRTLFPVRKCFVFERPANTQKMRRMEELKDEQMEPSFVKSSREFCDYIFSQGGPKTMAGGLKVNGIMLASLAVQYTKAIASNQIPCLNNAVESLAKIQNGTALTKALEHYRKEMASNVTLPTETQAVLSDVHTAKEKEAIKTFMSLSFKDEKEVFQRKLMCQIHQAYQIMCKENVDMSQDLCRDILALLSEPLEKDLKSFMRAGGYSDFRDHLQKIIQEYKLKCGGRLMSEEVLREYQEGKAEVGDSILCADLSIRENERQKEVEMLKKEAAEQAQAAAEEQNRIKDQIIKDQQDSQKEHMRQLEEKIQEEREIAQKEHQKVLDLKDQEMKAVINELQGQRQPGFCKVLDVAGIAALCVPGGGTVVGGGLLATSKAIEYVPKVWTYLFGKK